MFKLFTQDWLNFFWTDIASSVLCCLLYCSLSSLMNTLEGECLCLHEISVNVNKLLAVLLLSVYFLSPFFLYWFFFVIFRCIPWSRKQAHYFCLFIILIIPFFIFVMVSFTKVLFDTKKYFSKHFKISI